MDFREEGQLVKSLMVEDVLSSEKTAFLVQNSWWEHWNRYVSGNGPKPGNMKNSEILLGFDVKSQNTTLITKPAWEVLRGIYECRPEVEIFIIDKKPDYSPANVYIKDPYSEGYNFALVSLKLTVRELKAYITSKRNLECDFQVFFNNCELNENMSLASQGITKSSNILFKNDLISPQKKTVSFYSSNHSDNNAIPQSAPRCNIPKGPDLDLVRSQVNQALQGPKQSLKIKSLPEVLQYISEALSSLDKLDLV